MMAYIVCSFYKIKINSDDQNGKSSSGRHASNNDAIYKWLMNKKCEAFDRAKTEKIIHAKNMFKNEKKNDTRIIYWKCLLVASKMAYTNSLRTSLRNCTNTSTDSIIC
ncbi:hypothetical protein V1478_014621 [Vespula squamosa]|uniref:Uncharacterized protein n=1 Tax=Vespula squamosa TaxID=30214 RepID=A0ABD2A2U8_VESSQ